MIGSELKQNNLTPVFRQVRSNLVAETVCPSASSSVARPTTTAPAAPASPPRNLRREGDVCIAFARKSNRDPSMILTLLRGSRTSFGPTRSETIVAAISPAISADESVSSPTLSLVHSFPAGTIAAARTPQQFQQLAQLTDHRRLLRLR